MKSSQDDILAPLMMNEDDGGLALTSTKAPTRSRHHRLKVFLLAGLGIALALGLVGSGFVLGLKFSNYGSGREARQFSEIIWCMKTPEASGMASRGETH